MYRPKCEKAASIPAGSVLCLARAPLLRTPTSSILESPIYLVVDVCDPNLYVGSGIKHRQESEVASAYGRADVKRLMTSAQTAVEFGQLAAYFDRQAEMYAARYEVEELELDRLLALPYHARSYPAQVESTRTRVDHFKGSLTNAPNRRHSIGRGRKTMVQQARLLALSGDAYRRAHRASGRPLDYARSLQNP